MGFGISHCCGGIRRRRRNWVMMMMVVICSGLIIISLLYVNTTRIPLPSPFIIFDFPTTTTTTTTLVTVQKDDPPPAIIIILWTSQYERRRWLRSPSPSTTVLRKDDDDDDVLLFHHHHHHHQHHSNQTTSRTQQQQQQQSILREQGNEIFQIFVDGIIHHPWFYPTTLLDDMEYYGIHSNNNNNKNDTEKNVTPSPLLVLRNFINTTTRFYIFLDVVVSWNCSVSPHDPPISKNDCMVYDPPSDAVFTQQHPIWHSPLLTQLSPFHWDRVKVLYFNVCDSTTDQVDRTTTGTVVTVPSSRRRHQNVSLVVVHRSGTHPTAENDNRTTTTTATTMTTTTVTLPIPLFWNHTNQTEMTLSTTEIEHIYNCTADYYNIQHRPYYITYIVQYRSATFNVDQFRAYKTFAEIHDNHRIFGLRYYMEEFQQSSIGNITYTEILRRSIYAGVSRSDLQYYNRLTEVMAAGSIPIVLADPEDWPLPFHPYHQFISWEECIIRLPKHISGLSLLKHVAPITSAERCTRRKKCYDIYRTYMETGRKVIDGIIQGLEFEWQNQNSTTATTT